MLETYSQMYNFLVGQEVTAIINAMTIGSFMKKGIAVSGINDLKKKVIRFFPDGFKTKKQEKIFLEGCIALENYINNSNNLDEESVRKINNIIINGVLREEDYAKVYITKLLKLSIVDLILLKELVVREFKFQIYNEKIQFKKEELINKLTKELKLESALVELSVENLIENNLIKKEGVIVSQESKCLKEKTVNDIEFMDNKGFIRSVYREVDEYNYYIIRSFKTHLGEKIVNLLELN